MVGVALIMVCLSVSVVLVHFVDWPNSLSRLWCRAAKRLIRSINAWKWPKQSYVHCKKHAVNWLFAQLHRSPIIWEPVQAMNWPQWAKMQSPPIQRQRISSISSRSISKFQSSTLRPKLPNEHQPSKYNIERKAIISTAIGNESLGINWKRHEITHQTSPQLTKLHNE